MKYDTRKIGNFNFDVLHIDSVDNIEADAFSMLVPFSLKEMADSTLNNLKQSEMIESKLRLPRKIYKKVR